jgi:V8-like Glu-specific endopeptidase
LVVVNVSTFADGNSLCTGTIISNSWIMTAAHCLRGPVTIALHKERVRKEGEQASSSRPWGLPRNGTTTTQRPRKGSDGMNLTIDDEDMLV